MATRVNHGDPGILASDAPGYVLSRRCAATAGTIPRWGQQGRWTVIINGAFTVGTKADRSNGQASRSGWTSRACSASVEATRDSPGFSAHAVDRRKPFISETGFRSFLGARTELTPGLTTEEFVARVIRSHITHEQRGKLFTVKE